MRRPTLTQVFAGSFVILIVLLATLFGLVLNGSRQSILESANRSRNAASGQIASRVTDFSARAEKAINYLQREIQTETVRTDDSLSLEAGLYSLLLSNNELTQVTLTLGREIGYEPDGKIRLARDGRRQITVFRVGDRIRTRIVSFNGKSFVSDLRARPPGGTLFGTPVVRETGPPLPDPTEHPTFTTPAMKDSQGSVVWSDLQYSDMDQRLPEELRNVLVSVQKAVTHASGQFLGVLRIALSTDQIDKIHSVKLATTNGDDLQEVFVCDNHGRLITRMSPRDRFEDSEGDLRVAPSQVLPEIAQALADPNLRKVSSDHAVENSDFRVQGETYLASYRYIPDSQDWIVGIVAPEKFYLGRLLETQRRLLWQGFLLILIIVTGGIIVLRSVRNAQKQIVLETTKMNRFEFAPSTFRSVFRDVHESLESLEKAKKAMRAMGKYVPIGLVRQLYHDKSEPVLGGELIEVSMMFTDIADFTTLSENLSPNALAESLGRYLDVMARAIHGTGGTIDKYIGDAIMAIWNAPTPVARHPSMACRAALDCIEASRTLFASPSWLKLPPFHTRFGIHKDRVMVGHFGAPDRMNFTAIGDGVNLASRLEGLNKYYGTHIIVSQAVYEEVREEFEFRLLDWVAVKGKSQGVKVYELVSASANSSDRQRATHRNYETGFDAYLRREFGAALGIFIAGANDPPSQVMADRCRHLIESPPGADWNGIYVSTKK